MIINDLGYLEICNEEVFGGSKSGGTNYSFTKNVAATFNNTANISISSTVKDTLTKKATYEVSSTVKGNSASIAFDNEAIGKASNTQSAFSQVVVGGESSSQSGTIVASAA
ncbi:MAG: hypothetical protein HEQ19_20665 [Gloeotrichia echinulata CP02]|jgi:hypothetical protein|nr:hypothetical protein [Gloeotrichia echinulata DEX184]